MGRFILRRLLAMLPIMLGVSLLVFAILHLTPGDPAVLMLGEGATPEQYEALRQQLGLDDPYLVQYARWIGRAIRLDLGRSVRSRAPVVDEIFTRLAATGELALAAIVLAMAIGIPVGVLSAIRPNS